MRWCFSARRGVVKEVTMEGVQPTMEEVLATGSVVVWRWGVGRHGWVAVGGLEER